jgi:hypothetical protein
MNIISIPSLHLTTKPKRALSPLARRTLYVLQLGGSVVRHNGKAKLFDHKDTPCKWFTTGHLKELHSFALIEPTRYVAHAPVAWNLTACGRLA